MKVAIKASRILTCAHILRANASKTDVGCSLKNLYMPAKWIILSNFVGQKQTDIMLEVKNASITIGDRQLFGGLSFTVSDGQIVCITGCSGCGKTTLLRAMLGFLPLDEGHISIDGELLTPSSAEEFRKHISYIPQELLLPSEWVSDMVRLPFDLKVNRGKAFSKNLLMGEWTKLELAPELYDKKVSELSGGERQRVVLSVSGLLSKSILLIDEPTSALDTESSALVLNYLRGMASRGCSIVSVSHDGIFAEGCDKQVDITGNDATTGSTRQDPI